MKPDPLPRWVSRWLRPPAADGAAKAAGPPRPPDPRLDELIALLLLQRKWSYLRYVHLREGLLAAGDVADVLSVGAGRGLAELALAVEFPRIRFRITDVASERTPNYQLAQDRARAWKLPNVEFGILDVTQPIEERFDLVASVEVLEHIEDDEKAIAHMRAAARKHVFCLVPFADDATLSDPRQARRAWARHQHYRFGYSVERFRALFEDLAVVRGCYLREAGYALRMTIDALDDDAIRARMREFEAAARADAVDARPESPAETQGIWVLARVHRPIGSAAPPLAASPAESTKSAESTEAAVAPPAAAESAEALARLREVRRRLVFYRSWSYFRYLHLREAFLLTRNVSSVLSVGSGRGLAELALAVEFPSVHFHLTDVRSPHAASADQVLALAREWGLENLTRSSHDILEPLPERYDLVASVEVLEHIEDHARAAAHMSRAARRYAFCLVPYADARTAADPARRRRAWEKDHHFRFGYAAEDLRALFPGEVIALRGCYWQEGGAGVVAAIKDRSDDALLASAPTVWKDAERDLIDRIPARYPEALGIWILVRPGDGVEPG